MGGADFGWHKLLPLARGGARASLGPCAPVEQCSSTCGYPRWPSHGSRSKVAKAQRLDDERSDGEEVAALV